MGHSKEHMVDVISLTLTEMRPALAYAGVREERLMFHENSQEFPADVLREGFYWLKEINEQQYQDYVKVRNLLTEEMWGRYLLWEDFHDHREVLMLNAAAASLKKAAHSKSRPNIFKKGYINAFFKARSKAKAKKAKQKVVANSSESEE